MHKKSLGQKIHLGVLAAMILVFGAVTAWNHMHEGFRFHDGLLRVSEPEDGVVQRRSQRRVCDGDCHPSNQFPFRRGY